VFRGSCLNIVDHVSLLECFVQVLSLLVLPALLPIQFEEI